MIADEKVRDVIRNLEREYVHAINAILGSQSGSGPDPDRWRGHAEARRQDLVQLHVLLGETAPAYTSTEWRDANGIYPASVVTRWRIAARAERNHEQRPECPNCGHDLDVDPDD